MQKRRRIKETAETADLSPARLILKPEGTIWFDCISPALLFLSADLCGSSSWFPHVHCDLSEQVKLLYLHHFVGQRVDPVSVHRLSGVSDPVEPDRQNKGTQVTEVFLKLSFAIFTRKWRHTELHRGEDKNRCVDRCQICAETHLIQYEDNIQNTSLALMRNTYN